MPTYLDSPGAGTSDYRSEEAQDIFSRRPPAILRWSNTAFLLILLLLLALSWFVHYPDLVQAPFRLTTVDAPKPVNSRLTARVTSLRVREGQAVQAGELLGCLESTARPNDVLALGRDLQQLRAAVLHGQPLPLASFTAQRERQLGELQPVYQTFQQSVQQHAAFLTNGFYPRKQRLIAGELQDLQQLSGVLAAQLRIEQQDLQLAESTFAAQRRLFEERVIPAAELQQEQSRLLAKQMPVEQTRIALLNNQNAQSGKRRELLELEKVFAEQQDLFLQQLTTLESAVREWRSRFLLLAPTSGRVHFAAFLEENQSVTAGQELFYVAREGMQAFGVVQVPQYNLGKVKVGQRVWVSVSGYPAGEYGRLPGRVAFVAALPNKDGTYQTRIQLSQGLRTNYGRALAYKAGLRGSVDIVTGDTRLLERLLYSFRRNLAR
ncbi:HlyD family efflux transporter periplasmic adaptor subunit [Hymenobacter oligotrophus]|uniref:HlyD family efflux transporter periplasmic adaptor subunit n=1 Tax=Hymenobacter oligotrophus TaxID=2319843 RepID=A0A3B7R0V3_9BACT|nr:HlyD family efflux transporter periplasmic adaptor subunit [Hymenobacter oligotrophus]AYA37714.1 HlyD family efflux transporter periplasmic adaptor subunit [Hymenobacter oligotrophus]